MNYELDSEAADGRRAPPTSRPFPCLPLLLCRILKRGAPRKAPSGPGWSCPIGLDPSPASQAREVPGAPWRVRDPGFKQSRLLSLLPFAQETRRAVSTTPRTKDHRCTAWLATTAPEGPACSRASHSISQRPGHPLGSPVIFALSFAFHLHTPVCTAPSLLKRGPQEASWHRGGTI